MKKYEPAITVVSLTLLFAVLALLVTGAVMRQPGILVPQMECKTVIGMYSEGGKRMVPGEPFDITIGPIDNIPEEWIIRFAEPNEPEESLVITQSGTDIALPTLDEQAHREPNEVKE